jgi:hypothetical protein
VLNDDDWNNLLDLIGARRCTPIIGAGACVGALPLASDLATQWATQYHYPLDGSATDLARVSQYLAITKWDMFPKDELRRIFQAAGRPNFSLPDDPHGLLADIGLPIYITTNYDDFMVQALEERHRPYTREFPRWNRFPEIQGMSSMFDAPPRDLKDPLDGKTLVYHLHGHFEVPQSIVLTEDDYLDFLIRLTKEGQSLIPAPVRTALAGTSLLFLGYSMSDWNFRVLLRGLIGSLGASLGYASIAVQLPPDGLSVDQQQRAQEYLSSYFSQIQRLKFKIFWGDIRAFVHELRTRWTKRNGSGAR